MLIYEVGVKVVVVKGVHVIERGLLGVNLIFKLKVVVGDGFFEKREEKFWDIGDFDAVTADIVYESR